MPGKEGASHTHAKTYRRHSEEGFAGEAPVSREEVKGRCSFTLGSWTCIVGLLTDLADLREPNTNFGEVKAMNQLNLYCRVRRKPRHCNVMYLEWQRMSREGLAGD